jgi:uncharacterized protein (DUF362 family)
MAPTPIELLAATSSPDGGFGYHRGQPTHLEPTCLAALALAAEPDRFAPQLAAALAAIQQHANADGSYRLTRGRQQAVWPTALVLFTRGLLNHPAAELQPIANKLLGIEGKVVRMDTSDAGDIDAGLLGWPWAEDTFSWVEPTAWACLALRAVGLGSHPRVQEGLRLLLDRAFDHGGANYGSRMILGKQTEPIPGSTCVLLLALQGVKDNPRVDAAAGYLRVVANQTSDLETLAWIKLALSVHTDDAATRELVGTRHAPLRGDLPDQGGGEANTSPLVGEVIRTYGPSGRGVLDQKITDSLAYEAEQTNGLGAGPFRLALAALALNTATRNPFVLNDVPTVATHAVVGSTRESAKDEPARASSEATGFFAKLKAKVQGFLLSGTGAMRPLPVTSAVHIAKADDYDAPLADVLRKQFEHFRPHVSVRGKRVILKPNLVEFHRDRVINTHPKFVGAVIDLFQREGASEVVVAEGPGHWRNAQFLVNESGLGDELRARGVRFVDVNHDEPVKVPNVGRTTGLEFLYLSKTVAEADVFVSLPKLKTHHWAGATLSLKNLFGILPGICYGWPKNELHWRGIPNSIVDIALTHTPHLAIIDGIVGMEGDGPLAGTAKHVGAVVMGLDLLAVDATGCRLMGLPPERLPTLRLAEQKRLGVLREDLIPQLGEPLATMARRFELPPDMDKQMVPAGK